jgi:hypothetical protein
MSLSWRVLPAVVAFSALGAVLLASAGLRSADAAIEAIEVEAIIAGVAVETEVDIVSEDDRGDLVVAVSGGENVNITNISCAGCGAGDIEPGPIQFTVHTNNVDGDGDPDAGFIIEFVFTVDCEAGEAIVVTAVDESEDDAQVVGCQAAPTATPPGPAATVTASATPPDLGCDDTSVVTIEVLDAAGNPVPAGTAVTVTASIGSIAPSPDQITDANGRVFVFYVAPPDQGGPATITAASGTVSGQTTVSVACGTPPTVTTAPPPTLSPLGGVITPPSTGDAGLARDNRGHGLMLLAAATLLVTAGGWVALGRALP